MAGGGASQQSSTSQLDPEIKQAFLSNKARATGVAENLGAREFAGFTPEQLTAFGITQRTATEMPGLQKLQSGAGTISNVANLTPEQLSGGSILNRNIASYMNPYTSEVVDRTMSDIGRARDIALTNERSRATAAKAFGGTRGLVAEQLASEPYVKQMGDVAAQLRKEGYTQATGLAESDINRETAARTAAANLGLTAGQTLADLGAKEQALGYQAGEALAGVGAQRQGLSQAQMDAIRNLPLEQQQIINQALSLQPAGGAGTQTASSGGSQQNIWKWLGI